MVHCAARCLDCEGMRVWDQYCVGTCICLKMCARTCSLRWGKFVVQEKRSLQTEHAGTVQGDVVSVTTRFLSNVRSFSLESTFCYCATAFQEAVRFLLLCIACCEL